MTNSSILWGHLTKKADFLSKKWVPPHRLVSLTGYNRPYASHLLSLFGRTPVLRFAGKAPLKFVPEAKRVRRGLFLQEQIPQSGVAADR
jgi:hypothetical protein